MHGLRLIIKEDVLPISDYPKFEAIRYIEAKRGQGSIQMWNEHKIDITKKTSNSYEVKADDPQGSKCSGQATMSLPA